jgi:hypothetical protein
MWRVRGVVRLVTLAAISVIPIVAQFTSFIDGTITDSSGAVVVNAEIDLLDTQTGILRKTQTSGTGYYRFPSLPASVFEVTCKAAGFETAVQRAVKVDANETRSINMTLEVGRSETEITVTGEAPQIQTSEARISGVISEKEVHDLPLVGRNYLTIANLTPGVTGLPSGGGQSYAQATGDIFTAEFSPGLNANGARGSGNNFMVDSASTNNVAHGGVTVFMPNAETIQEVSVMTNNFSAEYGRNSSLLVNAITKQGTNAFHGTASWYHTNNHLSARTLFQDEVPVFQRNEYGATLGGPIWKNHTFFFSSFDRLDSGVGFARTAVVATPDFVNYVKQARPDNISTNIWTSYPASIQPVANFSTAGSILGQNCGSLASPSTPITTPIGPLPCNFNVYGDGNFSTTLPRNGLQWNARVDHTFNHDNDRLYGNIYRSTLDTILFNSPSVYPAFTEPSENYALYFNLNETHIFTPTVLNEFGGSYVRVFGNNLCDPCSVPGISVQGIEGFGQGWGPGQFVQNIYEWRDVVSINKGAHSLRVGAKVQANQDYDDFGKIFLRPNYYFASIFDFANDQPFSQSNIGIDPVSGQRPPSSAGYTSSQDHNIGVFIQDDWKVRRNLTINLGLRWEIFPNLYQRHDKQTNILMGSGNDFTSRIADASVGYTSNHHLLNQAPKTWAPRIGLAWDPTGSGRMSVRAGAGIFYDRLAEGPISTSRQNPPLIAVLSASVLTPPTLPVFGLGTDTDPFNFPYPTGLQYGLNSHGGLLSGLANVNGADRDISAARTYNVFLGVQYALTHDLVVEGDYVVSSGHGLYVMYDVNRFNGDLIQNDGVLTRLNPYFGAMNLAQSRVNSFYNGGIFSIRKRFGHGFSVDGSYTFGKSIDGATVGGGGNEYDGVTIADSTNLARERGLSEFDVRQRFSFKGVWQLPGSQLTSTLLRSIVGGWQLSGVLILQSGIPFSVTCSTPFQPVFGSGGNIIGNSGCDYNADGFTYDYPNTPSWGNTKTGLSRSDYIKGLFTAADFPAPPLGQEGDLGRNTFHGPGFANTDASLFKGFNMPWFFGESAQMQFRLDVFNLFNRVNLTQVNGDLASPVFGRSTSTYPARDIQAGLRLSF